MDRNEQKYAQMRSVRYKDQKNWAKKNMKSVQVLLHKEYEADVIDFWNGLENKRQWFIETCRKAMEDTLSSSSL